ncbi:MAG: hypothetical protein KF705_01030 [Phycisphaeraceae bacterium]|nr:hypothetical protein [Phycisphaeraceae bacterium]
MDEIRKSESLSGAGGDGAHEERDELVPLAEPEEHGSIKPPPVATAPQGVEVRTPTVVKERYVGDASGAAVGTNAAATAPADTTEIPPIVRPGFPGPNTLIISAGVLTLGAVGMAGYFAPSHAIARGLATLYDIAVHTGTGIVAVMMAAVFTERRFSEAKVASARMFFAVSLLYAVVSSNIPIPTKIDEWVLGLAAYTLALWGLFRLPRHELTVIGVTHAGLWLIVKFGAELNAFIASRAAAP